jgi:hypothetical protein
LEPVRQSGSSPAGPDKTGRKVHPAERNRIFASLTSKMNRPDFCRIFCQFDAKKEPAGFQPDRTGQILNPAGPDRTEKTRPVPTLKRYIENSHRRKCSGFFQFLTYSLGVGEDKSEYSYHAMFMFSVFFSDGKSNKVRKAHPLFESLLHCLVVYQR